MSNRTLHKLKAVALRSLRPGHHADGGGLYLAASPNRAGRSWVFRTRRDGRLREIGLGSLDAVTLESARRKSQAMRAAFADGRDPLAEKREAVAKAKIGRTEAVDGQIAAAHPSQQHQHRHVRDRGHPNVLALQTRQDRQRRLAKRNPVLAPSFHALG